MRKFHLLALAPLVIVTSGAGSMQTGSDDPMAIPAIRSFVGQGFGTRSDNAPAETYEFGRLVGVWHVDAEIRRADGSWMESAPGIWAWKYALDGFAVSDLWFQSADNLPVYMANLGRDYLLMSNRIFDVGSMKWQVAWMANGSGQAMGADFGTFTAVFENDEIVMTSPPGDGSFGLQRVVFHDIEEDSFQWKSEYATDDGKPWNTVMRLRATRIVAP